MINELLGESIVCSSFQTILGIGCSVRKGNVAFVMHHDINLGIDGIEAGGVVVSPARTVSTVNAIGAIKSVGSLSNA